MQRIITTGKLIDLFLAAVRPSCAASTWKWYERNLIKLRQRAAEKPVTELTDTYVAGWLKKVSGENTSTTQYGTARAVVRMLNWATAEGLITRSPLQHFVLPAQERRNAFVTPAQYAACLRLSTGPLRDAIKFLHHTGCRPQEFRILESRWLHGTTFKIPIAQSKGKRKSRVIYLDSTALNIARRLCDRHKHGPIFRNANGTPWRNDSLSLAFNRLGKVAGIGGLCAYGFRHAFITRLLEKGVDVATVAAIAGNSTQMVLDWYNHVGENERRLLNVIRS